MKRYLIIANAKQQYIDFASRFTTRPYKSIKYKYKMYLLLCYLFTGNVNLTEISHRRFGK